MFLKENGEFMGKSIEVDESILLGATVEDLSNYDQTVLWELKLKLKQKGEEDAVELINRALEMKKKRDKKEKKTLKTARLLGLFMGFFDD